jgi:CheY-like chemotaxis protein
VESEVAALVMDYDPERLLQIVYNLLSNAVKFTPSGGRVTLRLQLEKSESGKQELLIAVTDTGVGIPPEDLPFVFNRFFQAGNRASAGESGSGIGLSLTAELVKAMGGTVSADSAVGAGSTFAVRLPVSKQAAREPAPVFVPASPQANLPLVLTDGAPTDPLLLIIEDNPDVVEYLGSALGEGYRLEFAYNGRAGIEKALEIIPDIVVSDVMMPEKDGFEVCEALRNDERSSHIPIVLLTARAGVEDRIAGLRRGADAYLAKPFHPEELRVTLLKLIEMRRSLQARYAVVADAPAPAVNEAEKTEDAFLQKLRSAVESHLSDPGFSGEELCRALGMSYPVVYRKLSALTGRSLNVYIRLIRLQKARDMLLSSALGIAEIAYETGFNDPKFFSRVFSEEFGMPPSVFREKMGK